MPKGMNVLGGPLQVCSRKPLTGFYRDGCCSTGPDDLGLHLVCTEVNEEFLAFQRMIGNDLSTPVPEYGFEGLKPGDRWCVCVERFAQALDAGIRPGVVLEATHVSTLEFVTLKQLEELSVSPDRDEQG